MVDDFRQQFDCFLSFKPDDAVEIVVIEKRAIMTGICAGFPDKKMVCDGRYHIQANTWI